MTVDITDNSQEFIDEMQRKKEIALEMIGIEAEKYASYLTPVDTGYLRDSISHAVDDDSVYIGTNVEYAPYIEFGTGDLGTGTGQPWNYKDAKGVWHRTSGSKPHPYLRPAVEDHISEYQNIVDDVLKK